MRAFFVFAIIILIGAAIGYFTTKTMSGITIGGILAAFLGTMLYVNEMKKQS